MRISVVTPVYEDPRLLRALESVWDQKGDFELESVVIDGGSSSPEMAEALDRAREMGSVVVSEPDDGLYDAMNKGVTRATGEVVGILNADDRYASRRVLARVTDAFDDAEVDLVYGDLIYESEDGEPVRTWRSGRAARWKWWLGWMPPHPTFFVRARMYEDHGLFDPGYPIAADYDLMLRFMYVRRARWRYVPEVLAHMAPGGNSATTPLNVLRANLEVLRSWMVRAGYPNPVAPVLKPLRKVVQLR